MKTEIITFKIEGDLKEQLQRKAEENDLNVSQIIRRLIKSYLQGGEKR